MPPLQESPLSARPPLPPDNRSTVFQGRRARTESASSDSFFRPSVKQTANASKVGQEAGEGTVEDVDVVVEKFEFEMVDVTVTVLGMTGIVSESLRSRSSVTGRPSKSPRNGNTSPAGSKSRKGASEKSVASTLSTAGDAGSVVNDLSNNGIPVTAVMSFYRNVTNSQTTIATHVPSIPLGSPTSAFGSSSRFTAMWPGYDTDIANGDEPSEQASFKFSRLLKKERTSASGTGEKDMRKDDRPVFSPEIQEFRVGLGRGNQLVPLGVASLVITGAENGITQVNLPIKGGRDGIVKAENLDNTSGLPGKKKKPSFAFRKTSPKKSCIRGSAVSFQGDPRRIYMLDETATLRLLIKTTIRESKNSQPMRFSPDDLDRSIRTENSHLPTIGTVRAMGDSSLAASTREDVVSALSNSIAMCDDEERFADDTDDNCYYGSPRGDRTMVGSIEISQDHGQYEFDPDEVHYVMDNGTMHVSSAETEDQKPPHTYGASFFNCGRMCTVMETSQPYPDDYEDTSVYSAEDEVDFGSASEPPSQVYAPKVMGATVKHVRRRRPRSSDSETQDSRFSDSDIDEDEEFYADDERDFRRVDSGTVTTLTQSIDGTNVSARNMQDIRKARDMIHRYANRIGVNPEDLV